MVISLGLKRAISTVVRFPPIVLAPTFSHWTIGPIIKTCGIGRSQQLSISFRLTWANIFLNLIMIKVTKVLLYNPHNTQYTKWSHISVLVCVIGVPFLILIQFLDGCMCSLPCCSTCCQSKCFPVKKLTFLDVTDMDFVNEDIETAQPKIISGLDTVILLLFVTILIIINIISFH